MFEAMLYGPLAEGPEVVLKEDPPEALQWILEYVYRGHTRLPEVALTVKVYQLASKYQMEALMALCSEVSATYIHTHTHTHTRIHTDTPGTNFTPAID